ncbi:hypothetical protein [Yokenella regensburgei]|uniref:hypothetical protein n=1 Tax=Yokenella regensburgei TaxID=158877 RepID=UPI003EDA9117
MMGPLFLFLIALILIGITDDGLVDRFLTLSQWKFLEGLQAVRSTLADAGWYLRFLEGSAEDLPS